MIKDMFDKQVLELKKLWANKRQLLFQLLNLAMIIFSALMIWKGLMFMTKVSTAGILLHLGKIIITMSDGFGFAQS
jgi:signal peptidase